MTAKTCLDRNRISDNNVWTGIALSDDYKKQSRQESHCLMICKKLSRLESHSLMTANKSTDRNRITTMWRQSNSFDI